METNEKQETLGQALNISNDDELFALCIKLCIQHDTISEMIKTLMCSELSTKEVIYCAFQIGRLQEIDDEKRNLLLSHYALTLLKKNIL